MTVLLLALAAGMAIGYSGRVEGKWVKALDTATTCVLFVILAMMGAKLASPRVLGNLGVIGAKALAFSGASVVGSILMVKAALWLTAKTHPAAKGVGKP